MRLHWLKGTRAFGPCVCVYAWRSDMLLLRIGGWSMLTGLSITALIFRAPSQS